MSLLNLLETKNIIFLDGAMGTELERVGLSPGGHQNILNPEKVVQIHKEYLSAGSQIITTNTFAMNRIYIETHKVDVDIFEINSTGVKLAKSVVNDSQYVLGDIGSTGQLLEPYGEYSEIDFMNNFKEQAKILSDIMLMVL